MEDLVDLLFKNYPKLCVGDFIYELVFDDVNFNISKTKIIRIDERETNDYFLLFSKCYVYVCEDGLEFDLSDIDKGYVPKECDCYIFSSLDMCKDFIKQHTKEKINQLKSTIAYYQYKLEVWENRNKLYNDKSSFK